MAAAQEEIAKQDVVEDQGDGAKGEHKEEGRGEQVESVRAPDNAGKDQKSECTKEADDGHVEPGGTSAHGRHYSRAREGKVREVKPRQGLFTINGSAITI